MIITDLEHLETISKTDVIGGALAPTCVSVRSSGNSATATNNCGTRQRVKIVFAFGRDSDCEQLEDGESTGRWTSGIFANFDRLESC